ncbi:MAG: pyridoxal-phosphate dependent enzyme, partial [Desulfobacterota bacterium]|nr:pyridoxal-phosphate dependent enzyme [Thermodesulfobacteriota bacterium]
KIKIVGVEPTLGHRIQGLKNMNESIVPKIFDPKKLDERIIIDDETAFNTARKLAVIEGIFVGMSSGAAMAGALKVAQEMESGTVVLIFPDRGDRYLSTALFTSICAECPP